MLQYTKRQVQMFEMFYHLLVPYFTYETSVFEEQESLVSCSLVPAYDSFPPLFLCSLKPLENPHYSLEMKLHSHFVLFIFKSNRDSKPTSTQTEPLIVFST